MELWIRSQNKMNIVKVNKINVVNHYSKKCISKNEEQIMCAYIDDEYESTTIYINGEDFAIFNSEERALEVLNEIEERICLINTIGLIKNELMLKAMQNALGEDKIKGLSYPYQIPKE